MDRNDMILRTLAVEVAYHTFKEMQQKWSGVEDGMVHKTDFLNVYRNQDLRYPEAYQSTFEADCNSSHPEWLFSAPMADYDNARALADAFIASQEQLPAMILSSGIDEMLKSVLVL